MYIHMYAYVHLYMYIYTYMHTSLYMHVYNSIHFTHMCLKGYMCMYIHIIDICMYTRMHMPCMRAHDSDVVRALTHACAYAYV